MSKHTLTLVVALSLVASPAAAEVCDEATAIAESLSYLRRLSLDLRGRVPTLEEQASVVTNGAIDPSIVEAMVESEDLIHQVRRHHLDMLWTNVNDLRLTNQAFQLSPPQGRNPAPAYFLQAQLRRNQYRGGPAVCLDEPARFDRDGAILTTPDPQNANIRREGWVEVEPYWAPGTTIRVCAFDAQTAETWTDDRGNEIDCASNGRGAGCGCGPNLRWCQSGFDGTTRTITTSMNEQLLRYMDAIVREDRPYTDVVLGKDFEIDGPLAFWLAHQSQTGGNVLPAAPLQDHAIPDRAFSDATWQTLERGDQHAGVLSMPGYLLKFGSNRGRANRFYEAFLCQHFESNEPIPPATDDCHKEPDLTKRCGCKGCHLAVEPAAAHWGRWAEAGLIAMTDDRFPAYLEQCAQPGAGRRFPACRLFYFTDSDVTDPESEGEYVGMLRAYVFADDTRAANIEAGPLGIASSAVESGVFASCTVQKMWTRLMSREPSAAEAEAIATLASDFEANGYRLKSLIQSIVERPEYVEAARGGE